MLVVPGHSISPNLPILFSVISGAIQAAQSASRVDKLINLSAMKIRIDRFQPARDCLEAARQNRRAVSRLEQLDRRVMRIGDLAVEDCPYRAISDPGIARRAREPTLPVVTPLSRTGCRRYQLTHIPPLGRHFRHSDTSPLILIER
ncbi:MAG: hypothetical protein IT537_08520 [Hyphomicrobiales bacterium]|nr:hypothetical protein [Hyphomicrobiales bacterium]